MNDFDLILSRVKNRLAVSLMLVGAVFCLIIILMNYDGSGLFDPLSVSLMANILLMVSFAAMIHFGKRKKLYRLVGVLLVSPAVWSTLLTAKQPDMAGGFIYLPVIVVVTTFISGTRAGILVCAGNVFALFGVQEQLLITYDSMYESVDGIIFYDRALSLIICLIVGSMINHTLSETARIARDTEERVQKRRRLTSLGAMVGGIAHEFNNPIQIASMSFQCLSLHQDPKIRDQWVAKGQAALARIEDITHSLLYFTDSGAKQIAEGHDTRIAEALLDTEKLLRSRIEAGHITFTSELDPEHRIIGKRFHLGTVFRTIIDNAIDDLHNSQSSKKYIRIFETELQGKLMIHLVSNGEAIPQNIAEKMFEPFFTTKEGHAGIGLSTCYAICKALQWEIFYQRAGKENHFVLSIPAGRHIRKTDRTAA